MMKAPSDVQILIVDDETDLLDMLVQLFKSFGFSVLKAENGRDALDVLGGGTVDLVLTDVRMPQMDGVELLKQIRERDSVSPAVLLTSGYTDYSTADLYGFGANGFFVKPFGAAAVRNAVSRSLLVREERWAQPSTDVSETRFERKFASPEQMIASGEVKFGTGGFFLGGKGFDCKINEGVSFGFAFDDGAFAGLIEGTGFVRWIKSHEDASGPAGIGIEIKTLTAACRDLVCVWLAKQNFVAFIPQN